MDRSGQSSRMLSKFFLPVFSFYHRHLLGAADDNNVPATLPIRPKVTDKNGVRLQKARALSFRSMHGLEYDFS